MKRLHELGSILERWRGGGPELADAVLATVVHVRGSAYRRPGARMLVLGDGTRIGTISGGCLETEVARKAWWWTDEGATVRVFDNTVEDAARDFGLGCNGVITVLLERIAAASSHKLLRFLDGRQAAREGAVVVTVVRADAGSAMRVGEHVLYDARGVGQQASLVPGLPAVLRAVTSERRSRLVRLVDADLFVEWVAPPQRLVIFGAGLDAVPVATLASMMGWNVVVADSHPAGLETSRFPMADALFVLPATGDVSRIGVSSSDAVVVMTHNYPQDTLLVPQLLAARPRYLGLLGPRVRAEKMFAELGESLEHRFIHAPVGLDIGGDQPEGIALAIVAEIQCELYGQQGGRLRQRKGTIHAPALEVDAAPVRRRREPEHRIQPTCELAHG